MPRPHWEEQTASSAKVGGAIILPRPHWEEQTASSAKVGGAIIMPCPHWEEQTSSSAKVGGPTIWPRPNRRSLFLALLRHDQAAWHCKQSVGYSLCNVEVKLSFLLSHPLRINVVFLAPPTKGGGRFYRAHFGLK